MHAATDLPRAVAFDLDGTLIDTAPDLGAAANAMLTALGSAPLAEQRSRRLIGGGITPFVTRVLAEAFGVAAPEAGLLARALALFTRRYGEHLFEHSRVYPGVFETLRRLAEAGISLCCVTNKESSFALPLLQAAGLDSFLAFTLCADRPADRKPSPNLLFFACARFRIEPADLLFVGDAPTDVLAARAAGCRALAVDYGYSDRRVLLAVEPDALVSEFREIPTSIAPHSAREQERTTALKEGEP